MTTNSNDSGMLADQFNHPIDFFEEYQDKVTGYVGKASGISYMSSGATFVTLTSNKNANIVVHMFDIQRLTPYSDGASIRDTVWLNTDNILTPYGFYKDNLSGVAGCNMGISFSANKCIQAHLYVPRGEADNLDAFDFDRNSLGHSYMIDVQNLIPDGEQETADKSKQLELSSNVAPGGPTKRSLVKF